MADLQGFTKTVEIDLPRVVGVHQPKPFFIYIILLTQVLSPPVTSPLKIYSLSVPLFLRFRSRWLRSRWRKEGIREFSALLSLGLLSSQTCSRQARPASLSRVLKAPGALSTVLNRDPLSWLPAPLFENAFLSSHLQVLPRKPGSSQLPNYPDTFETKEQTFLNAKERAFPDVHDSVRAAQVSQAPLQKNGYNYASSHREWGKRK